MPRIAHLVSPKFHIHPPVIYALAGTGEIVQLTIPDAGVAELVDAPDLGSGVF